MIVRPDPARAVTPAEMRAPALLPLSAIARGVSRLLGVAGSLFVILSASPAHANGRFPGASQLVLRGNQGAITSSFGIVTTESKYTSAGWACEVALGYDAATNNELSAGIFDDGALAVAGPRGLTLSTDGGCTNTLAGPPLADRWMSDVSVDAARPSEGLALSRGAKGEGDCAGEVFETKDRGRSWTAIATLPKDFCALTVDAAPSDSKRIYVSGNSIAPDGGAKLIAQILVSEDRGVTWTTNELPNEALPFIGAIDPTDANLLYVRTLNPLSAGNLYASNDAGKTFRHIAKLTGIPLQFFGVTGLALSPDGSKLAYGSINEGLFIIDRNGTTALKQNDMPIMCLTWTADGLYACSQPSLCGPFFIGLSPDEGRTFSPLLQSINDVQGDKTVCAAQTPAATSCPAAWGATKARIGACGQPPEAGASDADADAGPPPSAPPPPSIGCDCNFAQLRRAQPWASGVVIAGALTALLRSLGRRRRR